MSISRHVDEYFDVEGTTPSVEVDVEELPVCHQFLPAPGMDVRTTSAERRLEEARLVVDDAFRRPQNHPQ